MSEIDNEKKKWKRWQKVLLVVGIVCSVLLIGIFANFLVNIIMAEKRGLNGNVTVGVPYTMDGVYVDEI